MNRIFKWMIVCGGVVLGTSAYSQVTLTDASIPGLEVTVDKQFDGGSLWGYMNGGADIYLEYGFLKLFYYELKVDSLKFKLEVYEMNNPLSALGIFSVNHRFCISTDSTKGINCMNRYQFQMVRGKYYVNTIAFENSDEARELMIRINDHITDQLISREVSLPEWPGVYSAITKKLQTKIFKGSIAVDNHLFEWSEWLSGIDPYILYYWPLEGPNESTVAYYFLDIKPADQLKFYQNLSITSDDLKKVLTDGRTFMIIPQDKGLFITETK